MEKAHFTDDTVTMEYTVTLCAKKALKINFDQAKQTRKLRKTEVNN